MPELVSRYDHRNLDVACSLDATAMAGRGGEWRELLDAAAVATEVIPGGARIWLAAGAKDAVDDLARREAECCAFLDFEVALDGGRVRLDITSPTPEAQGVIAALAGL